MEDHIAGRRQVISELRKELFGPSPAGNAIDTSQPIEFDRREDSYGPWFDASSGEEILQRDPPTRRYGVGVLYPRGTPHADIDDGEAGPEDQEATTTEGSSPVGNRRRRSTGSDPADDDDLDLSGANDYRPSSMALTFLARPQNIATISLRLTGGRYSPLEVRIDDSSRTWWLRSPVLINATFGMAPGCSATGPQKLPVTVSETDGHGILIHGYSRPRPDGTSLITIAVVNAVDTGKPDRTSLFQTRFVVSAYQTDGSGAILPYPRVSTGGIDEQEERSFELLYRHAQTFAVGHGCAADWEDADGRRTVSWVSAEALPQYEAPSITPDIKDDNGIPITVSMARLGGLDTSGSWLEECHTLDGLLDQTFGDRPGG